MIYDVLYVDDEPENLTVFEAACADRFSVLIASSAAQALELMRSHVVCVLLADQRMPHMTGLELLERARLEFPQVVRMLVTAYADVKTAIDAINRGQVRHYLSKPWENDQLLRTLADGVEYYQMRSKLSALERRLFETERVYSLGIITAGLARELEGPVTDVRAQLTRARNAVRAVIDAKAPDSSRGGQRGQLLDCDEILGEALVSAERVQDVVRGVAVPTGPFRRQDVNISEILRLTLRMMQSELRAAASVEVDVHPVPLVSGSAAQLGHVILNLLVHALDTMAGAPRHRRALSIRLVHEEPWVVLEVGNSVSSDAVDFGSTSVDLKQGVEGLGLAISHSIVRDLGGRLHTEATPTGGAVRRLRMPKSCTSSPISSGPLAR
jgi:two-component system NtrC family sensor kinase